MSTRNGILPGVWLALCLLAGVAAAESPNLGKPIDPADITAWDISIQPDGTGLPPGAGTPAQGAGIFAEKCAQCHGPGGKGGVAGVNASPLVGGGPITDISAPMKTIANFWPFATTLSTPKLQTLQRLRKRCKTPSLPSYVSNISTLPNARPFFQADMEIVTWPWSTSAIACRRFVIALSMN